MNGNEPQPKIEHLAKDVLLGIIENVVGRM